MLHAAIAIEDKIVPKECEMCKDGKKIDFEIAMAFQPIVNLRTFDYYGYEALVRGSKGESAGEVFKHVNDENRYHFDQSCRTKAIETATSLNLEHFLSINFMPNAVYEPARCIQSTLKVAKKYAFPLDKIVFEFTETEEILDKSHLVGIVEDYQKRGFMTAIDDFGAGYSGIGLLCDVSVDIVKLDRELIKNINSDPRRQRIMRSIYDLLEPLVKRIVIEGVETEDELACLYRMGYRYFQGYLFAKPGFETLPKVDFAKLRNLLGEKRYYKK